MKDEIKEILDYLKDFIKEDRLEQINLNRRFISSLLDYITNLQNGFKSTIEELCEATEKFEKLQEENKRLKGKIKTLENNCQQAEHSCRQHRLANKNHIRRLKRREKQINLYKSRNEKALDKLYCYGEVFDRKILQDFQREMIDTLGDDKDVKD